MRVCPLKSIGVPARQRGNAAQVLQEVEDYALAAQQRAGVMPDDRQHLAGASPNTVKNLRMADNLKSGMSRRTRVKPRKDLKEVRHGAQPSHHQLLPSNDRRRGAQLRIDRQVGRGVGHGPIFDQGLLQQCVNAGAFPVHGFPSENSF
jgi:hypothetical protein